MDNPTIAKWTIRKEIQNSLKYFEGYTDQNMVLSQYPQAYPKIDITGPVLDYMYQDKEYAAMRPTFVKSLIEGGAVEYWGEEELKWSFKARSSNRIVAKKRVDFQKTPGRGDGKFSVSLNTGQFKKGDVLAPVLGTSNQMIVLAKTQDGTSWVYTGKLSKYEDEYEKFFPPALLEAHLEWMKIDSVQGEHTSIYGGMGLNHGLSKITFSTHMTTAGKAMQFTDKGHATKIKMIALNRKDIPMEDIPEMIIDEREAQFVMEIDWEREKRVVLGRGAGKQILDPSSQYHFRIGPGTLQFMERANLQDYPLYGDYSLENFAKQVVGPTNPFGQTVPSTYDVYTGAGGDWFVKKLIKRHFGTLPATLPSEAYFELSNGEGGHQAVHVKSPYFATFELYPYGKFNIHMMPLFDNPEVFGKVIEPESGYLLSSFTFMIFDKGKSGGNVKLVEKEDSEVYTYNCGTWSPVGPFKGSQSRGGFTSMSRKAGYEVVHSRVHGVRIHDITATVLMQPAVKLY